MAVRTANRSRSPLPGPTRPGRDRASHGGRAPHLRMRPGAGHLPHPVLPALRRAGRDVGSGDVRPATLALTGGVIDMIESAPVFGVLAGSLAVACTVPYVRDTLRGTTVPHRGSWLIWSVLEVVAVEAQRADGARWSLVPLVTQIARHVPGVRTRGPARARRTQSGRLALLALAGVGVAGWLAVDVPVIATGCVIAADLVAMLMMVPKTWRDPHSETLSTFVLAAGSGALAVGSVGSLSVPLLAYPVYFVVVNAAVSGLIAHRRAVLARPTCQPRPPEESRDAHDHTLTRKVPRAGLLVIGADGFAVDAQGRRQRLSRQPRSRERTSPQSGRPRRDLEDFAPGPDDLEPTDVDSLLEMHSDPEAMRHVRFGRPEQHGRGRGPRRCSTRRPSGPGLDEAASERIWMASRWQGWLWWR